MGRRKTARHQRIKRRSRRREQGKRVSSRSVHQKGGWAPANVGGWRSQAAGPVGCAWVGGQMGTWPGVFGSAGGDTRGATISNYYPLSKNGTGPLYPGASTRNRRFTGFKGQSGGRKSKHRITRGRKRKGRQLKYRGGALRPLVPQVVANTFWQAGAAMKGLGAAIAGKVLPPSSHPSVLNQPINKNYVYLGSRLVDIDKIHTAAGDKVATM